jgi:hypothetical protein
LPGLGQRDTVSLSEVDDGIFRELSIQNTWNGLSPAQEKQREKRRILEAKSCGQFGER